MSYARQNRATIRNAFGRLTRGYDVFIESGMSQLLDDAMNYAISIHDHGHFGHRTTEDSYGWVLIHNGEIKQLKVNEGRHGSGNAESQLRSVASEISEKGWIGVVLASMTVSNGRKPLFFEVSYELGVLNFTADEIADHFNEYFKPLHR